MSQQLLRALEKLDPGFHFHCAKNARRSRKTPLPTQGATAPCQNAPVVGVSQTKQEIDDCQSKDGRSEGAPSPRPCRRSVLNRALFACPVALAALLGGGCHRIWLSRANRTCAVPDNFTDIQKFSYFVSPRLVSKPPRRIVLACSGPHFGSFEAQRKFALALASEIRLSGASEVVVPGRDLACDCDVDTILRGRFDEYKLLDLAARYHADAVLFVRVNELRAYRPMGISITTALVDVHDAIVIMSVDGNWELRDPDIGRSFERFVKQRAGRLAGPALDLQFQAPSNLLSFAAWQVASTFHRSPMH